MSKTNKVFSKQPVQIQNYSGFDLSHYNCGTLTTGTLTPVLVEPLVPADRVSLGTLAQVDLPPLATSFYGRVDFKMEAFFVPYRILMQQWQKFMRYKTDQYRNFTAENSIYQYLPTLKIHSDRLGNGSLADYLGYKGITNEFSTIVTFPNPLPFLAYHKIYDCWYRDKLIQKEVFVEESPQSISEANRLRNLPWTSLASVATEEDPVHEEGVAYPDDLSTIYAAPAIYTGANKAALETKDMFGDGVHVWELRQRNYAKDYFTTATTSPQAGDPVALKFSVDGTIDEDEPTVLADGSGSFTIAALRAANSLQKFVERNNLAGDDYADQIQARFGIRPSDAAINYPIFLGSTSFDVYNRSVFQTGTAAESNNPFSSVAAEYGKGSSFGSGSLIDSFECTEHGLIMVLGSLVPHSFYATGTRRYMFASTLADFPEPLLASVGDQQIYKAELCWDNSFGSNPTVFGYAGRYSEAKFHNDEVHGELRDGASLDAFTVKRAFASATTELGTNFLQIPKTALDEVMAASTGLSNFSAWYQIYFEFHKASKLPIYCIPTLGDEKDTHTEYIDKGGKRL